MDLERTTPLHTLSRSSCSEASAATHAAGAFREILGVRGTLCGKKFRTSVTAATEGLPLTVVLLQDTTQRLPESTKMEQLHSISMCFRRNEPNDGAPHFAHAEAHGSVEIHTLGSDLVPARCEATIRSRPAYSPSCSWRDVQAKQHLGFIWADHLLVHNLQRHPSFLQKSGTRQDGEPISIGLCRGRGDHSLYSCTFCLPVEGYCQLPLDGAKLIELRCTDVRDREGLDHD